METILYFTDLHAGSHAVELAGVYARASVLRWRVVEIERDRTSRPIRDFLRQWRPAGCIMECGKLVSENLAEQFAGTPVVYIDPDPETAAKAPWTVSNDHAAIAELAARELSALEPKSYAFIGWCSPTGWSVERGRAFADEIRRRTGMECAFCDGPWDLGDAIETQRRFAEFLTSLPKPAGVFAANDYVAMRATEACRNASIASPQEVAFASVDNESMYCENSDPTITSIEPDFAGAGRMAADLLAEAIADPSLPPRRLKFGPLRIVRRQSSRIVRTADARIVRAVERIRRDACAGLSAADVVRETGLSRRLAERRFLSATGRTILEEIHEARLKAIFAHLRSDVPIGHIASLCGLRSDSYLKRFFKARTGMTPREWRSANRA